MDDLVLAGVRFLLSPHRHDHCAMLRAKDEQLHATRGCVKRRRRQPAKSTANLEKDVAIRSFGPRLPGFFDEGVSFLRCKSRMPELARPLVHDHVDQSIELDVD
ncbi:MAG: hypothetical protein U1E22_08710, partial [Coriobacteriia bacterium]|nr:hypothetical protein [Coriobacteriia bacterium]